MCEITAFFSSGGDDNFGALVESRSRIIEGVDGGTGLKVKVTTPIDTFENVDEVIVNMMCVEVGVVFVGTNKEVFGEGACAKTEEGVGEGEDFLGLAFFVGHVAFGADGDKEGVNACCVDGIDGFETRDFNGDHGACDVVDEVAKGGVFLGWTTNDSEGPDGVFAVIDVFDM